MARPRRYQTIEDALAAADRFDQEGDAKSARSARDAARRMRYRQGKRELKAPPETMPVDKGPRPKRLDPEVEAAADELGIDLHPGVAKPVNDVDMNISVFVRTPVFYATNVKDAFEGIGARLFYDDAGDPPGTSQRIEFVAGGLRYFVTVDVEEA